MTTFLSVEEIKQLAVALDKVPGVLCARAWVRIEEQRRVYVVLKKRNRQRCWDLGAGRRLYVDRAGRIHKASAWAGAMTRDWHAENDTMGRLERVVAGFLQAYPRAYGEPVTQTGSVPVSGESVI